MRFLCLLSPKFMSSFRKIVGAVSKINSLRKSEQKSENPDKGDIIEQVAFADLIFDWYSNYGVVYASKSFMYYLGHEDGTFQKRDIEKIQISSVMYTHQ